MKNVYKSKQSEAIMMDLYDKHMESLDFAYEDVYVETRHGNAHIIKFGKPHGKPLLVFHGGNSTTPSSLERFSPLLAKLNDYCVFAVDTVGHPGKSAQTVLSHMSLEYGWWASDVISGLGFEKMHCMGSSFGAGILVKLMCVAPEKIEKSILVVPSGIANMSTFSIMISMGVPMVFYILTKKDYWLTKALLPMALEEKNIDEATYMMTKFIFEHVSVKAGMPSNVDAKELRNYIAPTFVIPAERDKLFPARKIIEKVKKMIPNLRIHLLENQGHMCTLPDNVVEMIVEFLRE